MKPRGATWALIESGVVFLVASLLAVCQEPTLPRDRAQLTLDLMRALLPACGVFVALYYNDLYNLRLTKNLREFCACLPRAFAAVAILFTGMYWGFPHLGFAEAWLGSTLISLALVVGLVIPLRWGLYRVTKTQPFIERILILGTGSLAQRIAEEINNAAHLGYCVVGFVREAGESIALHPRMPTLGTLSELQSLLERHHPHRIIVALRERRGRLPLRELLNARVRGIIIEDVLKALERYCGKLAIENLTPSFLIFSGDFEKPTLEMTLRRMGSLGIAMLGFTCVSPLMVLIALAIKLESTGPIFFIQERAGLRGRVFRLLKFRTMYTASSQERRSVWSRDTEDRVTRVGYWLRKTHLDELPQLVNVLWGHMDIVGPRPEIAANIGEMMEKIPYYALRFAVRPGLTGWAQVKYGYAVTQEDVAEKLRYDLYYIKHMSLWLDLRILIDTIRLVLLQGGSQGIRKQGVGGQGGEKFASKVPERDHPMPLRSDPLIDKRGAEL